MALATATIAYIGLAVAAVGTVVGVQGRKEAAQAYANSAREEAKARNQQRADNFSKQAAERRAQVREERVRRARILQASENSGTSSSSGEMGSVGSLSTQLNTNIGMNLGSAMSGELISGYMQNAANFNTAAQRASLSAQNGDQLFSLGMAGFAASGYKFGGDD